MSLIIVKCPKKKKVQIEDPGTKSVLCPAYCPLKQASKCDYVTFNYVAKLSDAVTPDIPYGASGAAAPASKSKSSPAAPAATAAPKSAPRIPVDDPFAASAAPKSASKIPVDDPFAATSAMTGNASAGSRAMGTSSQERANKYNQQVMDRNNIFFGIEPIPDKEPCFTDGMNVFYDRPPEGCVSAGNSAAAVRHIFQHWYVSRVFTPDGKHYQKDFLALLKKRNFQSREKELAAILQGSSSLDKKFHKLFYTVIYKNQISGFFWNNGESPFARITPRFTNVDDFYRKMINTDSPSSFIKSIEPCFEELVTYLASGETVDNQREWFKTHIPLVVAERTGKITFVEYASGRLTMTNLGDIRSFAEQMAKPASIEQMSRRVAFLKEFEITPNYRILKRERPLTVSRVRTAEDDGVYDVVGISEQTTSQSATAYNLYMTLLKEYVDVFKPEVLLIGSCRFTSKNFYSELLDIIEDAGAYFVVEEANSYEQVKRLYTVQSLFSRGVFEYFEAHCETDRLSVLKKAFVETSKLNITAYFKFRGIEHKVFVDGVRIPISEYLPRIVDKEPTASYLDNLLKHDKIIQAYIEAQLPAEDKRILRENVNRMMTDNQKLIDRLKESK